MKSPELVCEQKQGGLVAKGSLCLGEPRASSALCLIPSISAMDMVMPLGVSRLGIILELQSLQLDFFFSLSI